MTTLLLAIALFLPQDRTATRTAEKPDLNGSWTVVCYERDGKPMDEAKNASVTIKDNQITFQCKNGTTKIKTMKCEFTKMGHIRVTESDAISTTGDQSSNDKALDGVIIATKGYVAVCLHHENTTDGQAASASPAMKSKCTVILKRDGEDK